MKFLLNTFSSLKNKHPGQEDRRQSGDLRRAGIQFNFFNQKTGSRITRYGAFPGCLLAVLVLLCLTAPAYAAPLPNVKNLRLSYSLYVGGIHAMDGVVGFSRIGSGYKIDLNTGTQGFLRSLAPWDAQLVSRGSFKGATLRPNAGKVFTQWKDKPYETRFTFKKNIIAARFTPPEGDGNHEPVPEQMKRGSLDPLSGVLQVISNIANTNGECNQTVPIYDGHRRFNLSLNNAGSEILDGEDYSVFSGEATRCEVNFKMLAGSRKDREGSQFWQDSSDSYKLGQKSKSNRPPVYIFMGKVRDDLPELPVRAETSTIFGGIMIHLNKVEGGGGETVVVR